MTDTPGATYEEAGVSIEAGDKAVELMKVWVEKARRPEMLGGIGGFAGLFDASALKRYERPLLASSADGVGTKVAIAQAMDVHHTIGFDLVGMLVDDLVVCGAEPLFLTDYIATGRVVPERIAAIVQGIAEACVQAGLRADRRRDRRAPRAARPRRVRRRRLDHRRRRGRPTCSVPGGSGPGDLVVAMRSSGLHSNGYSLVRHVLLDATAGAGWALDRHVDELGRTLGEELLEPTRIYAKACLALARETRTHAMSHITGGGLAANLERVLPEEVAVRIDRAPGPRSRSSSWSRRSGGVAQADLEQTLNLGVGMVARRRRRRRQPGARRARASTTSHAWVCGEVGAGRRRRPRGRLGRAGGRPTPAGERGRPRRVATTSRLGCTSHLRAGSLVRTRQTIGQTGRMSPRPRTSKTGVGGRGFVTPAK